MGLMEKREFKVQQPGLSEAETASNGGENGGQAEIWRCDGEVKGGDRQVGERKEVEERGRRRRVT